MTIDTSTVIAATALLGGIAIAGLKQKEQATAQQPDAIPVPVDPRR